MTADELRAVVARHKATNEFDVKEDPNSEAHADRGALLDLLRAIAKGAAYRHALPTVEQIQAHEKRDGWWMARWAGEVTPNLILLTVHEGTALAYHGHGWYPPSGDGRQYHPCLPDGTPCAWPGEPGPWAALEALRTP